MSTLRTDTLQTTDSSVTINVADLSSKNPKDYDIRDYGILGDGSTDNTAAFSAMMSVLAANGGGTVRFPRGEYKLSTATIPNGVDIVGDGFGNTGLVLTSTVSTDLILVNSASSIKNIGLRHDTNPAGTVMVHLLGNKATLSNCQITNYFAGVVIGSLAVRTIGGEVSECNFFSATAGTGSGGIFIQNVGNATVRNNVLAGTVYPALQPDFGIRIHNADTIFLTDNNVTSHGYALLMDVPAALNCFALRMSGNLFDSAGPITGNPTVDSALINPAGHVYDTLAVNNWFGLSHTGCGLRLTTVGSGTIDGFSLENNQFVENFESGFSMETINCKNVQVTGGYASANTYAGYRVLPDVGEFQFIGLLSGDVALRGANGRGLIVETGTSNSYIIQGCRVRGNTVSNLTDGGSGAVKQVGNNIVA